MSQDQMNKLRDIVRKNPALVWYTKKYDSLNEEAIAEAVYNFGSWDMVCEFHKIVGLSSAKHIFQKLTQKPRSNLRPIVRNYFTLYYDKHAQ